MKVVTRGDMREDWDVLRKPVSNTKTFDAIMSVARNAEGIPCSCGGYAESVDVTAEEEKAHGCGRKGCCSRAFVCKVCKTRWVGQAEAPEME